MQRKTPMLGSLFNKVVVGLQSATLLQETPADGLYYDFEEWLMKYDILLWFKEHFLATASGTCYKKYKKKCKVKKKLKQNILCLI